MTSHGDPSTVNREALVSAMQPIADDLVRYVHEYRPTAVEQLLTPLGVVELRALAVVLASRRRPKRTLPEDGLVDELAVELAARGEQVTLTKTERELAAAQIVAWGHGPAEIAARLHINGTLAKALFKQVRAGGDTPEARGTAA
ncbi:UNVERIFIED_ORG: DNA-binding CsgD family transcriptional regulator [Microbispora rosea subsp. rosea]